MTWDLSVPLLIQDGKEVAMTYIAQDSLIPTSNWRLTAENEYSECEMDRHSAESHLPLPESLCHLPTSGFWVLLQGNMNHLNHCQGIDDNEDLPSTKPCLLTPSLKGQGRLSFLLSPKAEQGSFQSNGSHVWLPTRIPGKLYPRPIISQILGVEPRSGYLLNLLRPSSQVSQGQQPPSWKCSVGNSQTTFQS